MAIGIITDQGQLVAQKLADLTSADCLELEGDYTGTYANPVRIFSYGQGGVYTATYGREWFKCINFSGVNIDNNFPFANDKYYIFTYFGNDDPTSNGYFKVTCVVDSGPESALVHLKQGGWTFAYTLYSGSLADAQTSGACSDIDDREWDESPSADAENPFNDDAMGGEFADTDPFGFGNEDIDLPQIINEMDYSGLVTAYKVDNGTLFALGESIFSSNTWANIQNKFNGIGDPISYIVSAVEIPYSASKDGTKNFNLGGIDVEDENGNHVPCDYLTKRYHVMDFGSITLKETWGSEKDYSTTQISIYLPYVGVKDLDVSIVMNSTLTLKAIIDVWSGDLLYVMKINNKSMAYKYLASSGLVYRFQGNCGKQVPIGRADNTNQIMAMTGAMASLGVGLITGNPLMALGGAGGLIGASAMGQKVSMTGGITGAIGRGDTDEPYLIITQSVPVYPHNWREEFGAMRFQEFTISDLIGYTELFEVHADDVSDATDSEKAEIENLLKSGVIIT